MVLHLTLCGRLDLPILFLSGYINNHRSDYYRLLRDVTGKKAWKPWILFVLTAIEEQANSTARTIDEILILRKKIEPVIHGIKPTLPYKELVEYLFSNPYYSRSRLSESIGVHPNSSLKYLNTLEEAGLVQSFTLRREKLFFMQEFLSLL